MGAKTLVISALVTSVSLHKSLSLLALPGLPNTGVLSVAQSEISLSTPATLITAAAVKGTQVAGSSAVSLVILITCCTAGRLGLICAQPDIAVNRTAIFTDATKESVRCMDHHY